MQLENEGSSGHPSLRRLIVLAAEDLIMDYLGRTLLSQVGVT